jgi:rhamnose transport system ATP-binding protein
MADRIVVMHEGHIRHVFARAEATPEAIVTTATGAAHHHPDQHRAA